MLFVHERRYPSIEKIILQDSYYNEEQKVLLLGKNKNIRIAIESIPAGMLYRGDQKAFEKLKEMSGFQDDEIEKIKNKIQKEVDLTNNIKDIEKQIDEIIKDRLLPNLWISLENDNAWSVTIKIRAVKKWINLKRSLSESIETNIQDKVNECIDKGLGRLWELRNTKEKGWSASNDSNEMDKEGLNVYDTSVAINVIFAMLEENKDLVNEDRRKELFPFIRDSIYKICDRIKKENGGCFASELDKTISSEALCYALSPLITICRVDEIEGLTYSVILDSIVLGLNFLLKSDDFSAVSKIAAKLHVFKRVSSILPFINEEFNLQFKINVLQDDLLNQVRFRNNFYGWIDDKDISKLSIKNTSLAITSLIRSGVNYRIPIISQGLMYLTDSKTIEDINNDSLKFSYVLCTIIDYVNTRCAENLR